MPLKRDISVMGKLLYSTCIILTKFSVTPHFCGHVPNYGTLVYNSILSTDSQVPS